eukprot:3623731-Amphidinium_carterae.1
MAAEEARLAQRSPAMSMQMLNECVAARPDLLEQHVRSSRSVGPPPPDSQQAASEWTERSVPGMQWNQFPTDELMVLTAVVALSFAQVCGKVWVVSTSWHRTLRCQRTGVVKIPS